MGFLNIDLQYTERERKKERERGREGERAHYLTTEQHNRVVCMRTTIILTRKEVYVVFVILHIHMYIHVLQKNYNYILYQYIVY